jgi:hypothetical protein
MSTFGLMLSSAIFAGAGWTSLRFVIWNSVVAIISLYIAGRATGHLSGVTDRNIGLWHGIATFGMCFVSTIVVLSVLLRTTAPYSARAGSTMVAPNVLSVAVGSSWVLWCAMILGFIGAAIGGSHAAGRNVGAVHKTTVEQQPDIRRVA